MTGERRFRTIVVPMDFSEAAHRALEVATDLSKTAGPAHLILVHAYFVPIEIEALAVHGPHTILDDIHSHASDDLEKMLVGLQDEGISCEYEARDGSPDQVIVKLARDKQADLIVMGTRGRTGLAHAILGSVAERVIRTAPCPVMTVKHKEG
jgi:nucleotide-binding universal stress UspA family protein